MVYYLLLVAIDHNLVTKLLGKLMLAVCLASALAARTHFTQHYKCDEGQL